MHCELCHMKTNNILDRFDSALEADDTFTAVRDEHGQRS